MYVQFQPITQEIPKLLSAQGREGMGGIDVLSSKLLHLKKKKKVLFWKFLNKTFTPFYKE